MNRSDLEWALRAVIPHADPLPGNGTNTVGLDYLDGYTYTFTCNRYSAAIARVPAGADVSIALPTTEATELMRFVRPGRKLTDTQEIVYALRPLELHVGWDELSDNRGVVEADSAVFETVTPTLSLSALFDYVSRLHDSPVEWDELIVNPQLLEKFSKASRGEFDRLRIRPRRLDDKHGVAVVTIGADFVGAVAGMTYDDMGPAILADLLTERKVAA